MQRRKTSLGGGSWPWPDRPRVVVEDHDEARGLETAAALRRAGYAVGLCRGPEGSRERCPLVSLEDCPWVDGADAVVWRLGLDRPEALDVLQALRQRRPSLPLIVDELGPDEVVAAVGRSLGA